MWPAVPRRVRLHDISRCFLVPRPPIPSQLNETKPIYLFNFNGLHHLHVIVTTVIVIEGPSGKRA